MLNTKQLAEKLNAQKPQNGTKELIHQVFLADKNYIVREPKEPYQSNELHWFISQSRNIKDLEQFAGFVPKIWKEIAETDGTINSNYGWCCLSKENGSQFENAICHLELDKNSRRGIMIYNRPSMHTDWITNRDYTANNGSYRLMQDDFWKHDADTYNKLRGDFMCCQNNHFLIRDDKLEMTVHMRSLDAVFGYNADYIWFDFIFNMALQKLQRTYPELTRGDMVIYADSVHVYSRHYNDLFKEAIRDTHDGMYSVKQMTKKTKENKIAGHKSANPYLQDPDNNANEKLHKEDKKETKSTPEDPDHYKQNKIEHWDFVKYMGLDYLLGCATKYVFRNRFKGQKKQDLNKVLKYVNKFIESPKVLNTYSEDKLNMMKSKLTGLTEDEFEIIKLIYVISCTKNFIEVICIGEKLENLCEKLKNS